MFKGLPRHTFHLHLKETVKGGGKLDHLAVGRSA